ncbi:MAG: hypothetical protein K2M95_04650 [Clostridiales bacterium]|nr:hypothetical protein [Clostridiales bacterium]
MNAILSSMLLAFAASADALACGFAAGAGRIKVPMKAAAAAAGVSAAILLFGYLASDSLSQLLPPRVFQIASFIVLAGMGLMKLASSGSENGSGGRARRLTVREGLVLGATLSADGLAAGLGGYAGVFPALLSCLLCFLFSAAALYGGAKSGMYVKSDRLGNVMAGVTLAALAAFKLLP